MAGNYQAWVEVVPEFKGFNKSVSKNVTDSLGSAGDAGGKTFGSRLASGLGAIAKPLAIAGGIALAGVGVAAGSALTKGLDRALSIQDATAKLTGLGHSGESVQTIMNNALASVKGTAFGLGDAAGVAAGAVAAGIEPGEKLTRVLKLTADAATIAGTDLNSMGSIFNKVAASGKLQGDVIAQLQDAGVPVLQFVAKQMGVTASEAAKLASEGKVSFETFSDAMEEGLGGAALSSGKTARGAFANVGAALGRLGALFVSPLVASAPAFFSALTGVIDSVGESAKPFAAAFDTWVTPKIAAAATGLTGLVDQAGKAKDGLSGIKDLVLKGDFTGKLASAFSLQEDAPIVDTILDVRDALSSAGSIFAQLGPIFKPLGPQLLAVWQGFSPLAIAFNALKPVLPEIVTGFASLATSLGGNLGLAVQKLLPALETLALTISNELSKAVVDNLPAFRQLGAQLLDLALTVLPDLIPAVTQLIVAVLPLIPALLPLVTAVLPPLIDLLNLLTTPTGENSTAFGSLATAVTAVVSAVVFLLGALPGPLVLLPQLTTALQSTAGAVNFVEQAMSGKLGPVIQAIGGLIFDLATSFRNALTAIRTTVETGVDAVKAAFDRVFNSLPAPVRSAFATVSSVISGGIGGAVSIIASLGPRAAGAIGNLGGTLVGAGRSLVDGFVQGITGGIQRAASAAANVARAAVDAAKAALDINSPSRVFRDEVGLMLGLGMAEGIDRSAAKVKQSISGLTGIPEMASRSYAFDASVAGSSAGGDTYVQNPFTGEYLLARQEQIAGQAVAAYDASSSMSDRMGRQRAGR